MACGPNQKPGDCAYSVAQQQLGKPYVYSTAGPDTFDCSGLIYYSYLNGPGINTGRDTVAMWSNNTTLTTIYDASTGTGTIAKAGSPDPSQMEVGDILLFGQPGASGPHAHAQMYAGGNQIIQAPYTGAVVSYATMDLAQASATDPLQGIKRATGGGTSGGAAGTAAGAGGGTDSSKGSSTTAGTAKNPGGADTAFINLALSDPRNNLPFSPAFLGVAGGFRYVGPHGSELTNTLLVRGGIVQLMSQGTSGSQMQYQKGGQFACYFMMNPSSIATDCTINTDVASPATQSAAATQAAPSWVAQQTITFSLIFNRMYEVWRGPKSMPGPNGGAGPADLGVRWDIRAVERLMGMYDAQQNYAGVKDVNVTGLGVLGAGAQPPTSLPVQVVFGGPNSIQFQGLIASMDYTYTMFSSDMIPVEATVDISIQRQYLAAQSSPDLVNPMVTQYGQAGNLIFPYTSKAHTFNARTGIVESNQNKGIGI